LFASEIRQVQREKRRETKRKLGRRREEQIV